MILFPGLGISLNVSKIALSIFGINVYWYGIIIVSAIIIALIFLAKDDGKYGIGFERILDLAIILIPISIISARVYYVTFNFEPYRYNIMKIFDLREGGLAIYGAIIGGIITAYIYCKVKRISLLDMLDYLAPYLAMGQAIGRWGNFINIEAYGNETLLPWRMGITVNGIYKEVHPTFLYESISTVIIFIILYLFRNKRRYCGQIIYLYLFMYGAERMIIEGLRIDSLMYRNLRISQVISVTLFVIFGGILLIKKVCKKQRAKNAELWG